MRKLFRVLAYLAGITVWFPSFAPFYIGSFVGDPAGIQLAIPVFFVILILGLLINRGKVSFALVVVLWLWGTALLASAAFSPEQAKALRGVILFGSGFMVLVAASYVSRDAIALRKFLNGYISGAVISSLYAVYQIVALREGLPFSTLLNNNTNFSSFADPDNLSQLASLPRAFAFTPEPSVFASLLIPAVLFLLYRVVVERGNTKRNVARFAILIAGLVASTSISLWVSLPIALLVSTLLVRELRVRLHKLVYCAIALAFLVSGVLAIPTFQEALSDSFGRVSGIEDDGSARIRSGSMTAAVSIFIEHPLTGYGPTAAANEYLRKMPASVLLLEKKTGADSWPINTLAEQGILGFTAFGILVYLSLSRSRQRPEVLVGVVALLAAISLQTGYIMLYHVWAILGLGLGVSEATFRRAKVDRLENLDSRRPSPVMSHSVLRSTKGNGFASKPGKP